MSISNLNQLRSTRANLPCSSGSANVKRLRTHYKAPPCGGGDDSTNLAILRSTGRASVRRSTYGDSRDDASGERHAGFGGKMRNLDGVLSSIDQRRRQRR